MQEHSQGPGPPVGGDPLDELVRRAAAGDDAAWVELDRALRRRLLARVRGGLSREPASYVDAEDVVQEILLRLAVGLRTFEAGPPGSFGSWLRTLVRSSLADVRKWLGRQRRRGSEEPIEALDDLIDPAAEAGILQIEHRLDVEQGLGQLTLLERTILWECYVKRRSRSDVALELGLSVARLRALRRGARLRLARKLPPPPGD